LNATEATLNESKDITALGSVRRLEERLDDRRSAQEAAETRVAAAREEAERIVREAREKAEKDAAEHHRASLARADEKAGRVLAAAKSKAETLRSLAAAGDRPAAAREVVGMVLPGRGS
jgi:vacuolar-type H+-ATPase subunit H